MTLRFYLRAIGLSSVVFMLCGQPPMPAFAQPVKQRTSRHKAVSKLRPEIGPADKKKISDIREPQNWLAPWIRIHTKTVDISSIDTQGDKITITVPVAELSDELAKLPAAAWPYGRLLAASMSGPQGVNDIPPSEKEKTVKRVAQILKQMDVTINWWP